MTTPLRPKFPAVCFIILSVTMFLGGLGTLGAFILLIAYYPKGSAIHTAFVLALNGVLCWTLAVLCLMSAWKLLKQRPKAAGFSKTTWILVAGFTTWTLLFDGLSGWSTGGIAEVITWSVLEALIAIYLARARQPNPH